MSVVGGSRKRIWRVASGIGALALGAAALVACSSGSNGGSTSASTSPPPSAGSSSGGGGAAALVAAAQKTVDRYIAGTEGQPPSSGPKAVPNKTLWVISCGQAVPGCSLQTNGAVEAGKELGWKTTLYDGAFGANDGYNKGIRQAIAAKADGIIIVSIDCDAVSQSLREAKNAGVDVVSQNGTACSDDPSLITQVEMSSDNPNIEAYGHAEGIAQADYIIAKTNGEAKVLNYRFVDNKFAISINEGFTQEMAKCTSCSITNADIALADYANPATFSQKARTALTGAPDANAIHVPFDSFITGGVGPAVAASGRASDLIVVGSEGFEANLNLIREGKGQTAAIASDQTWIGWAGADTMNRVLAGEKPAPEGLGFKLVDKEHNLPASGNYQTDIDFKAAYKSVWGV